MEEYLGLYFENYFSNYLAIWIIHFPSIVIGAGEKIKFTYESGFPRFLCVLGTCRFCDCCFDILVPQRVDERAEDRWENSMHHVAHDVEVEG